MLRKSSYSLKIALFLSTVILFPLDGVFPMDVPLKEGERILIKQEPHFEINRPRKELKRLISIDRWREIIKKINPTGNRENCLECAICCYNLIKNQLETAERVGPMNEVEQNMICEDLFATFKWKEDNAKVDSKTVRLNLEDGSTEPVDVTFDAVVFEEEGSYQTLEHYLDAIPLKSTSCASSFDFRVGFLYLINKGADDTGHMINFYCRNSEKKDKYYIIDAQCGSIKTLENFLSEESGEYLNYLYVYYDKGENLPPLEASKNYIKLENDDSYEVAATRSEGLIKPGTSEPKLTKVTNKRPRENEKELSDQGSKRHKGNSEAPLLEESIVAIEALIQPNEIEIVTAEIVESEVTTVIEPKKPTKRHRKQDKTPSDQGSKNGPKRQKINNEIAPTEGVIESDVSIKTLPKAPTKPKELAEKSSEKRIQLSIDAVIKSRPLMQPLIQPPFSNGEISIDGTPIDGTPIFKLIFKDTKAEGEICELLAALIYLGCDWVKKPIEQMALQEQRASIGNKTLDLVKNFIDQQKAKQKLFETSGFSVYPISNKIAASAICTAAILRNDRWAIDIILDLVNCPYLDDCNISQTILLEVLNNYNNQKTYLIQKNAQWIKDIFWDLTKNDSDNQRVIESMTLSCAEAEEDRESLSIIFEMARYAVNIQDARAMTLWLEATILQMPEWRSKYVRPDTIFAALNHYKKLKTDLIHNNFQWIGTIIGDAAKSKHDNVRDRAAKALSFAIVMDFSWAKDQILLMAKSDSVNVRDTAVMTLNMAVMEGSLWAKDLILQMLKMNCFYSKLTASRALAELLEWKEKKTVETLGNMSSIEISSIWSRDNILKIAESNDMELKEGASCILFLALKEETQWAKDIVWDLAKRDSNNSRDTVAMALCRAVNGGDSWAKDAILEMIKADSYSVQLMASRTLAELLKNDAEWENYSKWASGIIKTWGNFDSTKLSSMTYGWVVAKEYHKARRIFYSLVSDRDKMWLTSVDPGWVAAVGYQWARDQIVEKVKGNAKDRELGSQALGRAISIDCPWAQDQFEKMLGSGDTQLQTFATLAFGEAIRRNSQWAIKKSVELGIKDNIHLGVVVSAPPIQVNEAETQKNSLVTKVTPQAIPIRVPQDTPQIIPQNSARLTPQIMRVGTTPHSTMLNNQMGSQMPAISQQANNFLMNQGVPQGMNVMTKITPQINSRVVPQGAPQIMPQNSARLTPQITRVGTTPPPTMLNNQMGPHIPAISQQANNFLMNQGVPQGMILTKQQQEQRIRELQEEIARLSGNREGK